jgi:hypothetical protein
MGRSTFQPRRPLGRRVPRERTHHPDPVAPVVVGYSNGSDVVTSISGARRKYSSAELIGGV